MGWSPSEFYNSTLADIADGVEGWAALRREDWEWERYNVRQMIYYVSQNLDRKVVKDQEDLWKLPMDDDLKRARHKAMPRAVIIKPDGTELK